MGTCIDGKWIKSKEETPVRGLAWTKALAQKGAQWQWSTEASMFLEVVHFRPMWYKVWEESLLVLMFKSLADVFKGPPGPVTTSLLRTLKDTEMEMPGNPATDLGQTLEWLREELAEMQIQDQQLLLELRHLHSILEELQSESTHWENTRPSRSTSPFRGRLGSEGRACQPMPRQLTQLLQGEKSRRSSLP
ncbi:uncharacterized protein C20orf202 homolog [Grammomys surdaster]|uniref:uncharacterized protein C20orf202 homolog n=1 Tax=Grammomys surdaster TaxID=491861 RepID=UPI0010A07372|nr:uncharacterized protein C20orf202 homolog [Grammomys surdaster]